MEYKVLSTREEIDDIIPKLIDQKLYLYQHWRMYHWYTWSPESILKISLAINNNKIIGVGLHTHPESDGINVAVFVKSAFRRKGIGTKLVQLLEVENRITYNNGYRQNFWNKIQ